MFKCIELINFVYRKHLLDEAKYDMKSCTVVPNAV